MNICPSGGTYCAQGLGADTCLFHGTGAECRSRKGFARARMPNCDACYGEKTEDCPDDCLTSHIRYVGKHKRVNFEMKYIGWNLGDVRIEREESKADIEILEMTIDNVNILDQLDKLESIKTWVKENKYKRIVWSNWKELLEILEFSEFKENGDL